MNFDQLTDADIALLISRPKRVTNPQVRWQEKPGHRQRNFKLDCADYSFELYLRQNVFDSEDFSCGLKVIKPDGQPLTLLRYNGKSHKHGEIEYECHIHRASERAMVAGKKPEHFASATQAYRSLDGALACLVQDAVISGLVISSRKEPDLFD